MKVFGQKSEAVQLCPGEKDCQIFQSAAGKTAKIKAKNACTKCPMLSTKTDKGQRSHKALERLASSAMQIRHERLTGYPRAGSMMTQSQFATLYVIEQIFEMEEIGIRKDLNEMLAQIFGAKAQ